MLNPRENPPLWSPQFSSVADMPRPWSLVHTMSNAERRVAWDCCRILNLPYFLPMERLIIKDDRRGRREVLRPIWPGYLCVAGEDRHRVKSWRGVCTVLEDPNQTRLQAELEQVGMVCGFSPIHVSRENAKLLKDRQVRITSKKFHDMRGVVERVNKEIVFVRISILGDSVPVEVHYSQVEAA